MNMQFADKCPNFNVPRDNLFKHPLERSLIDFTRIDVKSGEPS